jgi:hypothetical protein
MKLTVLGDSSRVGRGERDPDGDAKPGQHVDERVGSEEAYLTAEQDFTDVLRRVNVKISMDGTGRCIDNVFVERRWRSLK